MTFIHSTHIYQVPTVSWQGEDGLGWNTGKEATGRTVRKVGRG